MAAVPVRTHFLVHIPYYGNQLAIFSRPPGATTEIVDIFETPSVQRQT
jgi:hypothetical protein